MFIQLNLREREEGWNVEEITKKDGTYIIYINIYIPRYTSFVCRW